MNIILSDLSAHKKFLPLSYTRSIAEFRVGILTVKEKWEKYFNSNVCIKTEDYLQPKYLLNVENSNTVIYSAIIPDEKLVEAILSLNHSKLIKNNELIAYNTGADIDNVPEKSVEYNADIIMLKSNTDIFTLNGICIEKDFSLLTSELKSATISKTNTVFGKNPIFVGNNCFIECTTINTSDGPVYIGDNVKIMEGANIRGPFAICENAEVKMGAKIYGPTTIGPYCKVGGEINNSVFFSYSNKAHDGFLGQAVIGEWCNIGADSNNSNLKNNYAIVKLWDYEKEKFISTGLQFCGLIMGDHSKCGINTMFNTGTVIGVSANIFGAGFPRNFIPSFSWGGHAGMTEYNIDTAYEVMTKVMERRNLTLTDIDKNIFKNIFHFSAKYRNF
ncbi:MAG TPA: putative sugar nucleotidyl transferase [Bacteroidales bacterium]|nr:putative sugar nucleotidyl transferase [Bacteroidales bacterium]